MHVHLIAPDGARSYSEPAARPPKGLFPPLGLMKVAAQTPPDIMVSITDETVSPVPDDIEADVVGLTAMTSAAPRAYQIADHLRRRGIAVVMGGMHASALPEEALQHADAVVVGEAEEVWPQLLADFRKGRMQPIYRRSSWSDLTNLPVPRRDLIDAKRYWGPYSLQATRGCPNACSFCTVSTFFGRTYRTRPVEQVIAEVESIGGRMLIFVDDNIMGKVAYARELFARLTDLRIDFFAQASATILNTPDLIQKAARAGCKALFMGLETLSPGNLAAIGKSFNAAEKYRELVSMLHANGIAIIGAFMFGLDEDDEDVFDRTADFAEEVHIDVPQFSIATPLPGTRLYQRLHGEGRITETDWGKYDGGHVCFQPLRLSMDKLQDGLRRVYGRCYSWPSIIKRTAMRISPLVWTTNWIYHNRVGKWMKRQARSAT